MKRGTYKRDKIEKHINAVLKGSIEEALQRVAVAYLPNKEKTKEEVFKLAKSNPFQYLLTHKLQDNKGRVIASIGPLEHDLEGNLVKHISSVMHFSSPFLHLTLKELKNRFSISPDLLLAFINSPQIIDETRFGIIKAGLQAYIQEDYLTAVHLLIPQLEEAIRNMYESVGGIVLKPNRGTFKLKTLDELLREDALIEVMSEDLTTYMRVLLSDPRGWNMRNNTCHGLYSINSFDYQAGDRLIHAFLCLGLFRKVQ